MAKTKIDVFQMVTDRIIDHLENGVVPWRKPWRIAAADGMPTNIVSGKQYRGVNILVLGSAPYGSHLWMTYNQAKKLGGNVKRGERGYPVVYWKFLEKPETDSEGNETGNMKRIPMLRHFTVFNLEQCENVKLPKKFVPEETTSEPAFNPIECCEAVVENWQDKPAIDHQAQDRACYYPSRDQVLMPKPEQFETPEEYYNTLFHELSHSTGHAKRLNRDGVAKPNFFGSHEYSREELIAEFSAAMISGHCEIEQVTIENSAAYIKSWINALKNDKKLLVTASSRAEKSARMILNLED